MAFRSFVLGTSLLVAAALSATTLNEGHRAYERGDYQSAFAAWSAAAEAGDVDAQYALGALYSSGRGVQRDHDMANQWYLRAARGGQVEAQYRIGTRYRTGHGLPRDLAAAYAWYELAAQGGHRKAAAAMEQLDELLSAGDRAQARRSPDGIGRVPTDSSLSANRALVRKIQAHLKLLGHDAGAIDGFAGGQTKAALRRFQRSVGLPPDGKISYEVLDALREALVAARRRPLKPN